MVQHRNLYPEPARPDSSGGSLQSPMETWINKDSKRGNLYRNTPKVKDRHNLMDKWNCSQGWPYVKQSLPFQFVETWVEKAEGGQTLQEPLVIDERQHASDHWGRRLEGIKSDSVEPHFKLGWS